MSHHAAIQGEHRISSLKRLIKSVAGVSMLSLGFGLAVILIGSPLAISMWLAHEAVAAIARTGGDAPLLGEAFAWIVSTAAGLLLTALFARVFFQFVRRLVSRDRKHIQRHDGSRLYIRGKLATRNARLRRVLDGEVATPRATPQSRPATA
jgi:membrane protein implicated in regulation of membrane protease activity